MNDKSEFTNQPKSFRKRGLISCFLLIAGMLAIYLPSLCPSVYWWDSGEFIATAYNSGIPHPTGFPLYMLLAKLFLLGVHGTSAALRMNLLSALFSTACLACLYLLLIKHGFRSKKDSTPQDGNLSGTSLIAALGGTLLTGIGLTWWSQSVITEVYTMNLLAMGLFLFILMEWLESQKARKASLFYLLCLITGLGLAIHTEMLLVIPPFLLGLVLSKTLPNQKPWSQFILGIGFIILGLSIYLYIPIRIADSATLAWGHPETFLPLKGFLTQSEFGNKIMGRSFPAILFFIQKAFFYLHRDYTWAGAILGLIGLLRLLFKNQPFLAFTGLIALGNLFLAVVYGHPERMEPEYSSFLLPFYMVWGLWMANGIYWILNSLEYPKHFLQIPVLHKWMKRILRPLCHLFLIGFLLNLGWRQGAIIKGMKADSPRRFGNAVMAQLPQGSIVLVRSVYTDFILLYLQQVEGKRKDLKILSVNRKNGFPLNPARWLESLPEETPVYCEYELISSLEWEKQFTPAGYWGRIHTTPTTLDELVNTADDSEFWDKLVLDIQPPSEPVSPVIIRTLHPLALSRSNRSVLFARLNLWNQTLMDSETASLYEPDYSEPYLLRGIWYLQGKNLEMAQSELTKNIQLNPLSYDGWLNLGVAYAQKQEETQAESAFLKAVEIRPDSPQAWLNLGRLYQQTGQPEKANKAFQNIPPQIPNSNHK